MVTPILLAIRSSRTRPDAIFSDNFSVHQDLELPVQSSQNNTPERLTESGMLLAVLMVA